MAAFFVSVVFLLSEGLEGLAALVLLAALALVLLCVCIKKGCKFGVWKEADIKEGRMGGEQILPGVHGLLVVVVAVVLAAVLGKGGREGKREPRVRKGVCASNG